MFAVICPLARAFTTRQPIKEPIQLLGQSPHNLFISVNAIKDTPRHFFFTNSLVIFLLTEWTRLTITSRKYKELSLSTAITGSFPSTFKVLGEGTQ